MKNTIKIALLFATIGLNAQNYTGKVGINTNTPSATLDIKGDLRVQNIPNGLISDSILVTNNGFIRKIAVSSLNLGGSSVICPTFVKNQSTGYYLLFNSASSIPNPNNPLTIEGLKFTNAGAWVENNKYIYSFTNTTGTPLNINNFTVYFGDTKCVYN